MKIEHRFSFFIFQLAEKMNDPNIYEFFWYVIFLEQTYKAFFLICL